MNELRHLWRILLAAVVMIRSATGQGYAPDQAADRMSVADGLQVQLFASEPMVRQPNFVKCDDRGRLWTIQYLQYPNPAGLKRVKIDRWSRTVYDRVPKPPPRGPRGADKITILTDSDGDGAADVAKDFVDGLNLVTGLAFGHGGVYVLNVPYLLFYPDRDRDDVPDSDPKVLLTGFGMEDAQSMSNHLTWGPDGWLYGVNGSTTTCRIRGLEFQQGLWRYHPTSDQFELFCEGGSNCYGVTFDQHGEVFYSTNGGPFVHAVQGGYYFKSFGKHGPLHNRYAYHYFGNLECDQVPGGPPTGGTIYLGDSFPNLYRGKFIAGNFLGHTCSWWSIEPQGSTVRASFGDVLIDSNDRWFGATDMCLAPDGSMYVCDFHDQRTAHPDPDANWDRSNGRIFKIEAKESKQTPSIDVHSLSSAQLIELLSHPNHWYRNRARCELADRRDRSVLPKLREMATDSDDPTVALQGLWSYHVITGLDERLASELLNHPQPYVRYWTVRLLGDQRRVLPAIARRLAELSAAESDPIVRTQLAASAKRLPAATSLPIIRGLLQRNPHETDERVAWMTWWAIESHALTHSSELAAMLEPMLNGQNQTCQDNALRLVRRYAAEGSDASYANCVNLLELLPARALQQAHQSLRLGLAERSVGLASVGQGGLFEDQASVDDNTSTTSARSFEPIENELRAYIRRLWNDQPTDLLSLELALRAEVDGAYERLMGLAETLNPDDLPLLTETLALVSQFGRVDAMPNILRLFVRTNRADVQLACLSVLQNWNANEVTTVLLTEYPRATSGLRARMLELLVSRPESARQLLRAIEANQIDASQIPLAQIRGIAIHHDSALDDLVRKHWGNVGPGSSEQKLATMRRFNNDLRAGMGDAEAGKMVFTKHCGNCHQLHGAGNQVGPDLTTANRDDRSALLANIVDPSAVIRREYVSYIVQTISGRVMTGLLADQNAARITILDAKNQRLEVPRDEIEQIRASEVSLMPEKILDELTPEQLRDLFRYLEQ